MRLLIYEDICGGGCAEESIVRELFAEGQAMLSAVLRDFHALCLTESSPVNGLITHWDNRLETAPFDQWTHLEVKHVDHKSADDLFRNTLQECDAVLVIAPEWQGRLKDLTQIVEASQCRSLNCSLAAVELCSDKWDLYRQLVRLNIPTIPTVNSISEVPTDWNEVVVKPRYGVGSIGIETIAGCHLCNTNSQFQDVIFQPRVPGSPCSIAGFISQDSGHAQLLPVATQRLSQDGHFTYLGGQLPVINQHSATIEQISQHVFESINGLHGYVGIDLILRENGVPLVVEINPRLTTSYIGYQAMSDFNLANLFFEFPQQTQRPTANRQVAFSTNGTVNISFLRKETV